MPSKDDFVHCIGEKMCLVKCPVNKPARYACFSVGISTLRSLCAHVTPRRLCSGRAQLRLRSAHPCSRTVEIVQFLTRGPNGPQICYHYTIHNLCQPELIPRQLPLSACPYRDVICVFPMATHSKNIYLTLAFASSLPSSHLSFLPSSLLPLQQDLLLSFSL